MSAPAEAGSRTLNPTATPLNRLLWFPKVGYSAQVAQIKCWGCIRGRNSSYSGQLGRSYATVPGPVGLMPADMGDNLPYLDIGVRSAVKLCAGATSTCALLDSGAVVCWGYPGFPAQGSGFMAIACGSKHMCAMQYAQDNGKAIIKCWGDNTYGQLGQGSSVLAYTGSLSDAPAVDLGLGSYPYSLYLTCSGTSDGIDECQGASSTSTGGGHCCVGIINENTAWYNSSAKCWGSNSAGQLGYGDTLDRGTSPGHMGAYLPTISLPFPASSSAPYCPPNVDNAPSDWMITKFAMGLSHTCMGAVCLRSHIAGYDVY